MTKRTSKKRTSWNRKPWNGVGPRYASRRPRKPKRTSKRLSLHAHLLSMQKARAPFIVDMPATGGAKRKSLDYFTQTEALQAAKAAGTSDLPAVVWKHKAHGTCRPFCVVVEGRVFR